MDRVMLCKSGELDDDEIREVALEDGQIVAFVRHGGKIHAFEGECPHQGAPLADGEVEDGVLTCCLHFWTWRLETGEPLDADEPLRLFRVEEDDDGIHLVR